MALNPFQSNIALSLGSGSIHCTRDGKEIKSTPSCLLVSVDNSGEVTALGNDARRMEGRTASETMLVWPVAYGGVGDCELCAMLILDACEGAASRRRPLDKSRLVLTYNDGSTKVERAALTNAAELAGAKRVLAIKGPVAAAYNLGKRIDRPEGQLVISIGKTVTEVCVISGGAVVAARHMKRGSNCFNEAIVNAVRKKCSLVIGASTAEQLKKDIGSATQPKNPSMQMLSGRSILTGKPITSEINSQDIYEAMTQPVNEIISAVCDALYALPAQFSADILRNGICLTGGGSALYGLARRIKDETRLEVTQSAEPALDEVRGAYKIAADDKLVRLLINTYSAYEA